MKLDELYRKIEEFAPKALSDEYCKKYGAYDNSGILLDGAKEVKKVLFSLDFSSSALAEAKRTGANVLLTHHPAIYGKIGSILSTDAVGKNLLRAIEDKISVISMHLNFDCAKGGIDECLARGIGGEKLEILEPLEADGAGYGRVYDLPESTAGELCEKIKKEFHTERVLCYGEKKSVKRAASFCGAGASEETVSQAVAAGADCIVSSDFKHHIVAMAAEYGLSVIILTHYASENYGFEKIYQKIKASLGVESVYFRDEELL